MNNLKVLFLSTWFENPYKSLLSSNLENQKVQIKMSRVSSFFLLQIMREGKPDILHFHALPVPVIWRKPVAQFLKLCFLRIQIIILHFLGTKVVWTAHEWHGKIGLRSVCHTPTLFANFFDKSIDAIITHCETTKQDITATWQLKQKNKIFVVPHGNYIDWYENKIEPLEARKALGIPEKNLVFLLFGNIYGYKGVLETIDAFKNLPQEKVSLLIAGSLKEEELEKPIKDKIQGYENILFVPQSIPDNEVQIYMNACDCVVVPYKVFTTSGVANLAMSFGRVCIAPNVGFFSNILDKSGSFLYNSNHKKGLLKAMESSLENKINLPQMGGHNLELAKQWNWKYVAQETLKVYQSCMLINNT